MTESSVAEGFCGVFDPARPTKERSHYWKQSPEFDALRAVVRLVLDRAWAYEWTLQGFGMMRTYLPVGSSPKRLRLNVWNPALAVPNVSTIHDHPWDFTSWILSGPFFNTRFVEDTFNGEDFAFMSIKTGEGGGRVEKPMRVRLRALPHESYFPGDIYRQEAKEIHFSAFAPGTVTLNDRRGDTEHARVFWPYGTDWVDAKPRPATRDEVIATAALALENWK